MKDIYTKLLLHMDGTDGSTTFKDETGKTVTANGNAQIDTAQYKFGGASGLFDGNGDYLTVPDSADWYFGAGDFTIDVWARFASSGGTYNICARKDASSNQWALNCQSNNIFFQEYIGGSLKINMWVDYAFSTNTWYHIAFVRTGNIFKIFINGTQVGSDYNNSTEIINLTSNLHIGTNISSDYKFYFNGWLDEFRISKGIARWTANFTPPSSPYNYYIPCGGVAIGSPMIF